MYNVLRGWVHLEEVARQPLGSSFSRLSGVLQQQPILPLKLQVALSRYYLWTLGPNVGFIYRHAAAGFEIRL